MQKYKTGYCFTARDLFENFNVTGLKTPRKKMKVRKDGVDDKTEFAALLLGYLFYLIILDIIENNVTFDFSLYKGRKAYLQARQLDDEHFLNLWKKGSFQGLDSFKSGFKGYRLFFRYDYDGGVREKTVYVSAKLRDKFIDNMNNGKQYY